MSTLYVDNLQPNLGNSVKIPGHVIGFESASHNSQQTLTSSSYANIGLGLTYAAKSANSKLVISYTLPYEIYDAGINSEVIGQLALHKDGVNIGSSYQTIVTMQTLQRNGGDAVSTVVLTAGDTSTHSWDIYGKTNQDQFTVFRYGYIGHMTLMEIAQ